MNDSHFNQLSPAQLERLAILSEEMGEVQQVIGKIIRHGYDSSHPEHNTTNRQLLELELGDLCLAMLMLCDAKDISEDSIENRAEIKTKKIKQYLHHQ